jgi:hypothetical protein
MFRRWFEAQGRMPLLVDRTCGHIDRFVEIMFRTTIDELDTQEVIARDELFEKLCRVISLGLPAIGARQPNRSASGIRRRLISGSVPLWRLWRFLRNQRFAFPHRRHGLFGVPACFVFQNDFVRLFLGWRLNDVATCRCHDNLHASR